MSAAPRFPAGAAGQGVIALADAAATQACGAALAPLLRAGDVIFLTGGLGAGKTTFARGVLQALGLAGEAPSPSYPIVIGYEPPDVALPLWHVDLYRIADSAEIIELGLEDALGEGALLIEWPELLPAAAWPEALRLAFAPVPPAGRTLTWTAPAAWEGRWPPA